MSLKYNFVEPTRQDGMSTNVKQFAFYHIFDLAWPFLLNQTFERQRKREEEKKFEVLGLLLLFSCWVVYDSLWPHRLQQARLPCPSLSPGVCSNPCRMSQWCHSTISSSCLLFSACLQSFPASGSFPMSQLFASGGQSIRASASVHPVNIQGWFPLGLTDFRIMQQKTNRIGWQVPIRGLILTTKSWWITSI